MDRNVYTGTDMVFNFHPRILSDLQRSGFDILSFSNNHTLDRASIGVDKTLEEFAKINLPVVGARSTREPNAPLHTRTRAKGITVAWVACTEATNGWPDPNKQVLLCYRDADTIVAEIQRLSQDRTVDAVVVAPHWGVEYATQPNSSQRNTARRFLDAGADAIIGSHPHVLQPIEKYQTRDGRETVIAYSLGNFVSGQRRMIGQRLTTLLYVGFTKRNSGERAFVNGVSYLPLWMETRPHTINALETTTQAPKKEAFDLLYSLFDSTRELKPGAVVRTNLECH